MKNKFIAFLFTSFFFNINKIVVAQDVSICKDSIVELHKVIKDVSCIYYCAAMVNLLNYCKLVAYDVIDIKAGKMVMLLNSEFSSLYLNIISPNIVIKDCSISTKLDISGLFLASNSKFYCDIVIQTVKDNSALNYCKVFVCNESVIEKNVIFKGCPGILMLSKDTIFKGKVVNGSVLNSLTSKL